MAIRYELEEVSDDGTMNKILDDDSFNVYLEYNIISEQGDFDAIDYDVLPSKYQDELDSVAVEILDDERNHIAVVGENQVGKTFFIHQLVGNIDRYLKKLKKDKMVFFEITEKDYDNILDTPGNFETYIDGILEAFQLDYDQVCFVTESPDIASKLEDFNKKTKIIMECSNSTFESLSGMESSGVSKRWNSWHFVSVDNIVMNRKDTIELLSNSIVPRINDSFDIVFEKKTIAAFINYCIKQIPGLVDNDSNSDTKGCVMVPVGIWAVILRRMAGMLAISDSKDIKTRNGKVSLNKVINKEFKKNYDVLSFFDISGDSLSGKTLVIGTKDGQRIVIPIGKNDGLMDLDDDEEEMKPQVMKDLVFSDISTLPDRMKKEVIGQDNAVKDIVDGLVVPAAKLNDTNRPIRSMIFLGPTGVGKTKMAMTLAENAFKEPMNLVRIDMSEYQQPHEATKLFGAPPGYIGFQKGGVLTNAIQENPQSLILLDEIEKANPLVWDSFLQILDAGRATDGNGKTVDFSQTIIIMTSNIGVEQMNHKSTGFTNLSDEEEYQQRQNNARSVVIKELEKSFRLEMINRIDEIIVFNEISPDTAEKIIQKEVNTIIDRMKDQGYVLEPIDKDVIDIILKKSNIEKYGARDIQRVIHKDISNPLAYSILHHQGNDNNNFSLVIDNNEIKVIIK